MARASQEEIFELIKSCSYPNNKAKHLRGMAEMIVSRFGGVIPSDRDELTQLPGVGRKTANVIASVVWKNPVIAVDTHVFRVARRIGLTPGAKNPLEVRTEADKRDTGGAETAGTSLASAARTIYLHCPQTCM